ncbi:MAG: serine acetyltransferase [Okeania sp. SIO1H5]|uniref:serine O-acetyltransferase EpsC n=1 Tax=Okeania sp. SIO1H5 TaxID=2607777 RepID=UPI0013BB0CA4|nr:serine O-acetyltransferase EpsC [Okeania sp. SIO1H5]NET23818.1 serine acetyltransferase [Okeania sp. SIO1H5]
MKLAQLFTSDLRAVQKNDPAARSYLETLLCHSPLHAIIIYRIANRLHLAGVPLVPRLLATLAHTLTGVEIHPGAEIGHSFFIDHGTGVVIGETAKIGNHCILFHNVTLGGTGKHHGKRHPTLQDHVFIGTSAILLGPLVVGHNSKVGANSFIIMHDVPPNCTVVGAPAKIVKENGYKVHKELPKTIEDDE